MRAPPFRRPARGSGRLLLGVCAGLARRWELEPRTIRIALLVMLLPLLAGLLVYAALALVMPADGASDAEAGWRGEIGRSITEALAVLTAVLVVGLIGALAAALAVFGLGSVALLLATAALAGVIAIDHARSWLLGLAALALSLPAATVALTDVSIARQAGEMRIAITRPQDVAAAGYRAGLGSMLLDLRDFDADERTITTIRARADVRPLVVALPTDRCFNLEIDYRLDRSWLTGAVFDARREPLFAASNVGYPATRRSDPATEVHTDGGGTLVAFGRSIERSRGRYRRPGPTEAAPTIRLQLESARSQMYVRDYPVSVNPLGSVRWPESSAPSLDEIDGRLRRAVRRSGLRAADASLEVDPKSGTISASGRLAVGAISAAAKGLDLRDIYPFRQAQKLAGACAAPSEVRPIRARLGRLLAREQREYLARPGRSGTSQLLKFRTIERLAEAQQEPSLLVDRQTPRSTP